MRHYRVFKSVRGVIAEDELNLYTGQTGAIKIKKGRIFFLNK